MDGNVAQPSQPVQEVPVTRDGFYNAPDSWLKMQQRTAYSQTEQYFCFPKNVEVQSRGERSVPEGKYSPNKIGGQIIIEMSTCGCWRIRLLLLYRAGMVARNGGLCSGKLLPIFDITHLTLDDGVDRFRLIIQIELKWLRVRWLCHSLRSDL